MVVSLTKIEELNMGGGRKFQNEGDKFRLTLLEFEAPEKHLYRFILMLLN